MRLDAHRFQLAGLHGARLVLACSAFTLGCQSDGEDGATTTGGTGGSASGGVDSGGEPSVGGATGSGGSSLTGGAGSGASSGGGTSEEGGAGNGSDLCGDPSSYVNPGLGEVGHSEIAHWKHARSAVLTISFDDSTPGQAQIGVPAMIERGFTGTWFVNPGSQAYQDNRTTWEELAPQNFQELANHSMDHAGATDYADAEYQIGEVMAIIRSVYPPERSPLIAFNRGGGTTWNVTDAEYESLLERFYCVERVHSSGISPATPGETMYSELKTYLQNGVPADNWARIHLHGICDPSDTVNCVCNSPGQTANCREYGVSEVNVGAVRSTDFIYLLDQLGSDPYFIDEVWIAGFVSAHKYQQARDVSEGVLVSSNSDALTLCLTSELDAALFDEELTMTTAVPESWSQCVATQEGVEGSCRVVDGVAVFEARIDRGAIVLSPE